MRARASLLPLALLWSGCVEPTLTTTNDPPVVVIQSPGDGASFNQGEAIDFIGKVADDGSVLEVETTWLDNGTTPLGVAGHPDAEGFVTFTTADLAPGDHAISLRAVDGSNLSADASITLTVTAVADEPDLTIVQPSSGDHVDAEALLFLEATVSDAEDAPTELVVEVESDLDGFLCTMDVDSIGDATCQAPLTTAGTHQLTFTVTDTESFSRQKSVLVVADPVAQDPTITPIAPLSGARLRQSTVQTFQADVADAQDSPTRLTATLVADVDGPLCTVTIDTSGHGLCFASLSTLGSQILTWDVADTDGNHGTANVLVIVSDGTDVDDDGDGYTELQGDCDDDAAAVFPTATEQPNGVDDDCDGSTDEGTTRYDDDGDGYCESVVVACSDGTLNGDCDDSTSFVSPIELELCNGVDDNCNRQVDEADASDCTTWWLDGDRDGYGLVDATVCTCSATAPYTANNDDDCDDALASVFPGNPELPDRLDNNCDSTVDEGTTYFDDDGDGYCDSPNQSCSDGARPGDCNDGSVTVSPAAAEVCNNGVDDNCSGVQNEIGAQGCFTYYADSDGDGYGDPNTATCGCSLPGIAVLRALDCNDAVATINPTAPETANGIDDDCDGLLDEGTNKYDNDGDGYCAAATCTPQLGQPAPGGGDCDDTRADVAPNATEVCGNGQDDNCNLLSDEGQDAIGCLQYFRDNDNDGFGAGAGQCLCAATAPYVRTNDLDCYDQNPDAKPGQTAWFTSSRGDGSFDYDCVNGSQEKYSAGYDCGCPASTFGASPFVEGWDGNPGCGNIGSWATSCSYITAQVPNPFYPFLGPVELTECVSDSPTGIVGRQQQCR